MSTVIHVGQVITLGWNGSKFFNEKLAYQKLRVEAVGHDWVVLRDDCGFPWAHGFPGDSHENILQELTS